jgi:hypothetical protein
MARSRSTRPGPKRSETPAATRRILSKIIITAVEPDLWVWDVFFEEPSIPENGQSASLDAALEAVRQVAAQCEPPGGAQADG